MKIDIRDGDRHEVEFMVGVTPDTNGIILIPDNSEIQLVLSFAQARGLLAALRDNAVVFDTADADDDADVENEEAV